MRYLEILATASLGAILFGCGSGRKSSSGFCLPEGDAERGKALFMELKCATCHQVVGDGLAMQTGGGSLPVVLGGEFPYPRTDGELVTAIINPSHRLARGYPREVVESGGRSRMNDYNDRLTVRQLIDLVAFLQTHYKIATPQTLNY